MGFYEYESLTPSNLKIAQFLKKVLFIHKFGKLNYIFNKGYAAHRTSTL